MGDLVLQKAELKYRIERDFWYIAELHLSFTISCPPSSSNPSVSRCIRAQEMGVAPGQTHQPELHYQSIDD